MCTFQYTRIHLLSVLTHFEFIQLFRASTLSSLELRSQISLCFQFPSSPAQAKQRMGKTTVKRQEIIFICVLPAYLSLCIHMWKGRESVIINFRRMSSGHSIGCFRQITKALKKTESLCIVLFLRLMNFPNFIVQMTSRTSVPVIPWFLKITLTISPMGITTQLSFSLI